MQATSYSAPVSYELLYMLEHQYTDASLRLDKLKGPDLAKTKVLKRFADEMGFADPSDEHGNGKAEGALMPIIDTLDRSLILKRVVDADGAHLVAANVEAAEENVLQDELFGGRAPDDGGV
ncbi:hypothetical protein LTR65_009136 [Meristemomyces frigidus]